MSRAGKGDRRRPYDPDKWRAGWDRTFGDPEQRSESPSDEDPFEECSEPADKETARMIEDF